MLSFLDKVHIGTPLLRRVAFWLLTSFAVYVLLGFLAVPPIMKAVILDQIKANLNREASLEKFYFNPLNLHIEITNLAVRNLEEGGDLLSVGHLEAAPGIATLWEFAPVVAYLKLDNYTLNVTFYGNNRYSISDLLGTPDSVNQPADAEPEEEGTVFPFALYGFEMTNATITFDDRPRGKKHVISDIFLRVPFTSSIQDKVKEFTQPKFTAVVNGDPVELKGRTLPFDKTLLTEFELGAVDIDLDQYWEYLPIKTPLTLRSGRFTSDISLYFERPDAQRLNLFLGGGGTLSRVNLAAPGEGTVFTMDRLAFEMERFSLGDNALILKQVVLDKPFFQVIRNADDSINWANYFPGSEMGQTGPKVKTEADTDSAFVLDVRSFELRDGTMDFRDQAVEGGFARIFQNLNFTIEGLSTQSGKTCSFDGSLGKKGVLFLKGTATLEPVSAQFSVAGKEVNLPDFAPYLNEAQPMAIDSGLAGFSAEVVVAMADDTPNLSVQNGSLTLADLAVRKREAKQPSLTLASLDISGAALNLNERTVDVGEIRLTSPAATLVREKDGKIDLQKQFVGAVEAQPQTGTNEENPEEPASWLATVGHVLIEDGAATFKDLTLADPATLGVRKLTLDLRDVTTAKGAALPFDLSATWNGGGSFTVAGKATLDPVSAEGTARVNGLDLRPLDNYLAKDTDLLVAGGGLYANLTYNYADGEPPRFTVRGDTALADLSVKGTFADSELAGIDRLDVKSIDFTGEPYRLAIGEINLNGPRALVEFDKDGRLNIRRALRLPEPTPPAEESKEEKAKADKQPDKPATQPAAEEAAPAEETGEESFFDTLTVGKVGMQNGSIRFSDQSMEHPFATALTDMNLVLTDIGQDREARPNVDFKANIGSTPMAVTGVLNPLITPIYSDLMISVNGMELVPLTPYTLKNLAYPIEKGRLYADVTFKTEDWVLDAQNKFFIEQLVLGRKDKRPDAPNIPVEFGLSLLQDSNGDLELNLPINGRLDDPNFRIGGIVFRAIISLLFKALTSPFSLIGSIFGGGGQDMDFVVFEPGRYQISPSGEEKLATLVKALTERDKLKLEVDGVIDPTADVNGLTQVLFDRKIKQEKYDSLPRSKRAEPTVDEMVIAPEEFEDLLYEVYADEPDEEGLKPTTLFVTDRQPVEVMEKFVRERIIITPEMLHELAMQRAGTVKEYIVERNPLLEPRVFLLDREDAEGKTGVPKHRADLGID